MPSGSSSPTVVAPSPLASSLSSPSTLVATLRHGIAPSPLVASLRDWVAPSSLVASLRDWVAALTAPCSLVVWLLSAEPLLGVPSEGAELVPGVGVVIVFLSCPGGGASCEGVGLFVGGEFNFAWELSVDCEVDVELLLPLWAEVDFDLNDVDSRTHVVLLERHALVRGKALQLLDLSPLPVAHIHSRLRVVVRVLLLILKRPLGSLVDLQRVEALCLDVHCEVAPFRVAVLVGLVNVGRVVIDLGYGYGPELVPEVVEGDEEDAVVAVGAETDALFFLGVDVVPVLVIVGPGALELALAPRVTELHQPHFLPLHAEGVDLEEGVGVSLDDSGLTGVAVAAGVRGGDHGVFQLGGLEEVAPLLFLVGVGLAHVDLADGGPGEVVEGFLGVAGLDALVAGVEFGPGLLEDDHPDFLVDGLGEGRSPAHEGHQVVHVDGHPLALVEHLHRVVPHVVDILSQEQVENPVGPFGEGRQSRQEVAVAQVPLLNVTGVRLVHEDLSVGDLLRNLLPSYRTPF